MKISNFAKALVAATPFIFGSIAQAVPIAGTISFGGDGSPEGAATWYQSTGVNFVNPWGVTSRTGDYAGITLFSPATFTDVDWGAGAGAVNVLLAQTIWQVNFGGVTYTLTVGTVGDIDRGSAANDNISVSGTGTLTITGPGLTFDPTPGTWNFTGGYTGPAQNLSFSSAPVPRVPEPGTLALLSIALLGFGLAGRRNKR